MCDEKRLAALELKVGEEARLRAIMDKDQSDLAVKIDANTGLIQALRDTQKDHTRMLTRMETDVAGLKTDVAGLKTDVAGLKTDVAELKVGVRVIVGKLDQIIGT